MDNQVLKPINGNKLILEPYRINEVTNIKSIHIGGIHNIITTYDGSIYGFGCNGNKRCLIVCV